MNIIHLVAECTFKHSNFRQTKQSVVESNHISVEPLPMNVGTKCSKKKMVNISANGVPITYQMPESNVIAKNINKQMLIRLFLAIRSVLVHHSNT